MIIEAQQITPHIAGLFNSACINVFSDFDQGIRKIDHPSSNSDTLTAYINADSSDFNVSLLLSMPRQLLSQFLSTNKMGSSEKERVLSESILELSNQLLGKLKNQLVSDECRLKLGLPKLCSDSESNQLLPERSDKQKLFYEIKNNLIECHLAVDVINENMTMIPVGEDVNASFEESELELF